MTIERAFRLLSATLPTDAHFCIRTDLWRMGHGAVRTDYVVDIQHKDQHVQKSGDLEMAVKSAIEQFVVPIEHVDFPEMSNAQRRIA